MSLKLNSSGGGSVTIADPASTASNFTLNPPLQNGTLLTDSAGVLNIGSGQVYKDASGNVGIGTSSPATKLNLYGTSTQEIRVSTNTAGDVRFGADLQGAYYNWIDNYRASGAMAFATNNTERMRIDSSGNVLVGTTSAANANNNGIALAVSDGCIRPNHVNGTPTGYAYMQFGYNAATIGSITQNGTTATAYNTSSDYRLKENIQPLTGALTKVAALKPCTYTWKSAPDEMGEGFIAHELAEVCPNAVHGEKDAVDADGNPVYQGIDTSFLVATLTAAIQEQQALITQLTERVHALEAK